MKLDDALLMACVDGKLSPQDSAGLRQAIARSARASRRIALFQASRLPYREAFEHQKSPPVPARLVTKIDEMVRAVHTDRKCHA